MAFLPANQTPLFVFGKRESAERHALIQLDVIADDRGFADNDSRSVIYEKALADFSAGMNVYTRARVRKLRQHSWQYRNAHDMKLVRDAISCDRIRSRVAQYYFVNAMGRRVAIVCGLNIFGQHTTNARERFEKSVSALFGDAIECKRQLSVEMFHVAHAFRY